MKSALARLEVLAVLLAISLVSSLLSGSGAFLSPRALAAGTTYYVDSSCAVNGNGTSQACATTVGGAGPWNSLANAQRGLTGNQSDNKLLLRASQTYTGQFTVGAYGTAGHPFTIGSYGAGAKPVISGGSANIMINCANCQYIVLDGIEFTASTGVWSANVYIAYPAGHVTVRNCYAHHSPYRAIFIYNSSDNVIEANEASWSTSRGGFAIEVAKAGSSPQPTTGNIISNNKVHHNQGYGISIYGPYFNALDGSATQVYGNECYNNSTGIYLVSANGIELYGNSLHDNGLSCQGTNDCPGEDYGFAIQSGSNNDFHDNVIWNSHNTGIGVYGDNGVTSGPSNGNKIHRNKVYGTVTGVWKRDIAWQAYTDQSVGSNNRIFYNIFIGDGENFVIGDDDPSTSGNTAYNNVFLGGSNGVFLEGNTANAGWTLMNNIFAQNSSNPVSANATTGGLVLSNNLYYKPAGGVLVRYKGSSYTAANISNLDANALAADPRFIRAPSDLHLSPDSPAINAGVDVGLTSDFEGKPIVGLPDIGVYEFGSVVPTPTGTLTEAPASPTATSIPPTSTLLPPTVTNTAIPPSATPMPPTVAPTSTPLPTEAPTNTLLPPTQTPTSTLAPPTAAPTNTPLPPTEAPTNTLLPPTQTPTETPAPPTAAPTNTPLPTAIPTDYPAPSTNTPLPTEAPTHTATATAAPPATSTPTSLPTEAPTMTNTPTTFPENPTAAPAPTSAPTATRPSYNQPPVVNAGPDQTISLGDIAQLNGTVADDGHTAGRAIVQAEWQQVSGPALATIADPSSAITTASFSQTGAYTLVLTANDGELSASDDIMITVDASGGAVTTVESRAKARTDDAEERTTGLLYVYNGELDLVYNRGSQIVGIRFSGLNIPQGAKIVRATVQFRAARATSGDCSLSIAAENDVNAPPFLPVRKNVSSRPSTTARVQWAPAPWTARGEAGPDQQTPDLSPVVQEVVDRGDWARGNAIAIFITGTGTRIATSYDGDHTNSPLLHVEYTVPQG